MKIIIAQTRETGQISVNTIEVSVDFFNSDAFNRSPGGIFVGGIRLEATEVVAIGAFCRTINALENIRNSNELDNRAKRATIEDGRRILIAEIDDSIEVLTGGGFFLFRDAIRLLKEARRLEDFALSFGSIESRFWRDLFIDLAVQKKKKHEH